MADLTPEQQQEKYAAIELLYSEGQWSEVLQASEALLADLPPLQGQPLRPRLQLVIGHTLLYGLADLKGAEERYRTVLVDTEEPVLREIAEQGLARCSAQRQELPEAAAPRGAAGAITPAETPEPEPVADAAGRSEGGDAPEIPGEAVLESSAPAPEPVSAVAAMPWEVGAAATSAAGASVGPAAGAAMPWLSELGMEPAVTAAQPEPDTSGVETPFLSAPQTEEKPDSADANPPAKEEPVAEALTQQPSPAEEPVPAEESTPVSEQTTAVDTLARLREPDALIPVTVEVLEDPPAPPQPEAQRKPEPAQEAAPLSPEDMAELARGLLEVVMR